MKRIGAASYLDVSPKVNNHVMGKMKLMYISYRDTRRILKELRMRYRQW